MWLSFYTAAASCPKTKKICLKNKIKGWLIFHFFILLLIFLLIKTCWLLFCSFFIALMLLTFICGLAHNSSEVDLVTHKYRKKEKEWLKKKKWIRKCLRASPQLRLFYQTLQLDLWLLVFLWLLYKGPFFSFSHSFLFSKWTVYCQH